MKQILRLFMVIFIPSLSFFGCEDATITGDKINLTPLSRTLLSENQMGSSFSDEQVSGTIPGSRDDLSSMRTVVKIYNGEDHAGLTVPGFGGIKLGKKETNLNVYYIETKVVKAGSDTLVYGIGYSAHYLFKKLKRGIDISNLASVAASAQLQSKRTSVYYSLQTFGIRSLELVNYFKPQVNSNFDVDGFGVMQSSIDGIHNVLSDSLLSERTTFTPMELKFVEPKDLQR